MPFRQVLLRIVSCTFVFAMVACAQSNSVPKADHFKVDRSPPDCHAASRDAQVIDGIRLRFPEGRRVGSALGSAQGNISVLLSEDWPGNIVTLIGRDAFRDATSVMTANFPDWRSGRYSNSVDTRETLYARTKDRGFSTGLDMLAPAEPTPASYSLYLLQSTPDRITTLIACPFNPVAVTPMRRCTLYKADSKGIGYEVTFDSFFLPEWRELEAVARDVIADAETCGRS